MKTQLAPPVLMVLVVVLLCLVGGCSNVHRELQLQPRQDSIRVLDLTHAIPTFRPREDQPLLPDLDRPVRRSTPIAGFGPQAVLFAPEVFKTNQGHFDSAALLLQEHAGTHLNAPNHYVNEDASLEPGGIPNAYRKSVDEINVRQLTGPVVLIDVSRRVGAELNRNGGMPSPDTGVTDFSDGSIATVRASDITAIQDQLVDGAWLIANTGWSKFFPASGEDWDKSAFVNGMNHPGFTREAIDRLVEVLDRRGIKIAGIGSDSFTGDSGESAKGRDENYSFAWPAHVRLYQRDILILESLANVEALASAIERRESCQLVAGVLKHVGGTGGPARVVGMCWR
ncbi:cyclase family protein [Pelomonas aquatica]|jgi:kynurenine formamidase|uniref:Cyclase n=1 Tax=Pelomonas aquatica TaxID=431058 RepID=A0A9X4R5S3_9BURK|nr:cyclase family protein [Pelomonas aquatica]MCY4755136.1 cyclase family protein [Pelomonas aquatica]MDG0863594.1 cyclase [Pelomonas aquatica]